MQTTSDTASLVRHEGGEVSVRDHITEVRMPPDWTDSLEEAQYILSKIQTRLKELNTLQNKHLNKTSVFDDTMNEEKQIDDLTQEITKVTIKNLYYQDNHLTSFYILDVQCLS